MKALACLVGTLALLAAAPVFAKTPKSPGYQKAPQRLIFGDDEVFAGVQRPDGKVITAAVRGNHTSLIKVRANFIPELIKSAEDL